MSGDLRAQIKANIEQFADSVEQRLDAWSQVDNPTALRDIEHQLASLGRQVADGVTAAILKNRLAQAEFQAQTSAAARASGRYRSGGRRWAKVRLLGGRKVRVKVEYLKRDRRGLPGRPRSSGKRGKGGSGLYPALVALGIAFGATSALATEVCSQVADSDSFRAGLAALRRRGIDLGHKPTYRLVKQVSQRLAQQRDDWLEQPDKPTSNVLAGKRVVVATDGGRIRERKPRRRGRRRKRTRHRGFEAPWREPKMLVIYTIDDKGEMEDEFRPVYDGTLGDCEAVFKMLRNYLQALGAHAARELIVVGDGAEWIWNRADELRTKLGLQPGQLKQVLDWYHAVETLHEISKIPAKWSSPKRDRWVRRAKSLLFAGDIDGLVRFIEKIAKGRRSKDVRKHVGYFNNNRERMQYAAFKKAGVPLGSGAVESMIRRVVNLRMKGNAKFWLAENAEGMLILRSYLKAGRFDDLLDWSFGASANWWKPAVDASPIAPVVN